MIAVKIVGAIMILISGYMFGKHIKDDMEKRTNVISYMNRALAYIDNKIIIENAYLEDVLIKCSEEIYKQIDIPQPFSSASEIILDSKQNIVEAWEISTKKLYDENDFIKAEEKEYITQVGNCLSLADKDRQSEGLKAIMDSLEKIEKKADEKAKKDGKMAMKISMICAVLLIILVI